MNPPPRTNHNPGPSTAGRLATTGSLPRRDVEEILGLIADDVWILLPSWSDEERGRGGDFDCAVRGVDPLWPLRLDPHTSLRQCLEYDLGARFWILEQNGLAFAIDSIDDPHGLGKYAFPTSLLFDEQGLVPSAGARAAYLTSKRLRKGIRQVDDWQVVAALARGDRAFERIVTQLFGPQVGEELAACVLRGSVPSDHLALSARRAVAARRLRSPWLALAPPLHLRRALRRARWPTGLLVAVVGPDGSGKSTLAGMLPDVCRGLFRREVVFHWRPGVLPGPGALVGSAPGDSSNPHERAPHGRVVSIARLLYFWADFVIGSWTRFFVLRAKTGLIVLERGWWDILVDPRRYRLDVPPMFVKILGKLLPAADLTFVCEAPVDVLLDRKTELTSDELSRQTQVWRSVRTEMRGTHFLDASAPPERVLSVARTTIADHLESRSIARLGHGWCSLPPGTGNRRSVPRGPARVARSSLRIYQPMSPTRRVAWEAGRLLAGWGGLRLLPRSHPAPRAVREKVAPFIPRRGSIAVARANHAGRFFVLVLDSHGDPRLLVKVATDDPGTRALEHEAAQIDELGPLLPRPLRPPRIVDRGDGVLALHAERWQARWRPWHLDEDLAGSLGAFFAARRGEDADGVPVGPAHGDFAPWNLLKTGKGWVLIDWEHTSSDRPAFYDVFHHLVQSHVLLHRPSRRALLEGVTGAGPLARLLHSYARTAQVDVGLAPELLLLYAKLSAAHLDPARPDGRAGLEVRSALGRWVRSRP